jgi:hypothetical protein
VALAVNTAVLFAQMMVSEAAAVMVGVTATDTVAVAVRVPQLLVPLTVYTVVAVGATEVLAVVAPLLHTYAVEVPAAVKVAVAPAVQRIAAAGVVLTVKVGTSFTVTLRVLVLLHPAVDPDTV